MRLLLLTLSAMCMPFFMQAQTTRVQFLHNSPDEIVDTVDIYIGETLVANNLPFHSCTPYMNVAANQDILVAIAPQESTSSMDAFYSFPFNLSSTQKYQMVIQGVIQTVNYNPGVELNIATFEGAREAATDLAGIDINFFHGSTDAPAIDVAENNLLLLTAIEDLNPNAFSGYVTLPAANYSFVAQSTDGQISYSQHVAPFTNLGLNGEAITVITSGFMSTIQNNNGPSFGMWAALTDGGPMVQLTTEFAQMRFLHNSGDEALSAIDIYANGIKIKDNLPYHFASSFVTVPANVNIQFGVSAHGENTLLFESGHDALVANSQTVGTIQGIYSETGYSPAPAAEIAFFSPTFDQAQNPGNTDVLFIHGSTDAPNPVNVVENTFFNMAIVSDLAYSDYAGYLEVPTIDLVLDVVDATTNEVVASFNAPLASYGWENLAITALAGGFADPAQNNNGAPFGIWIALPGEGAMLPLDQIIPTPPAIGFVQLVHASADAQLETVDIYVDGQMVWDNLTFRNATMAMPITAETFVEIGVAPSSSESADDVLFTQSLMISESSMNQLVLQGIYSVDGYSPAPEASFILVSAVRNDALVAGNTDIRFVHAATDVPELSVDEITINATIVSSLMPGGNTGYIPLSASNDGGVGFTSVFGNINIGEYGLPFNSASLAGAAVTIVSTGFLNPANNSDGPSLEWWVVKSDGTMFPLVDFVNVDEIAHPTWTIYPNPAQNEIRISGQSKLQGALEWTVTDASGKIVKKMNSTLNNSMMPEVISLSDLQTGVYELRLSTGQLCESSRFAIIK